MSSTLESTTSHRAARPVVLLVEDDDVDAKAMERAFRRFAEPPERAHARDGVEGLDLLHELTGQGHPCIVILDLNMPRMNGLEFLERVRSDDGFRDVVVFVFTTSADVRDLRAAYGEHVAGYFVKGSDVGATSEFAALVEDFCRQVRFPVDGTRTTSDRG